MELNIKEKILECPNCKNQMTEKQLRKQTNEWYKKFVNYNYTLQDLQYRQCSECNQIVNYKIIKGGENMTVDLSKLKSTLEGKFIKLKTDQERVLLLANPTDIEKPSFSDPNTTIKAIRFDVIEADGEMTGNKLLEVQSKRLLSKLYPYIEKMQKENTTVKLSITKIGEKFETNYIVKEVKE